MQLMHYSSDWIFQLEDREYVQPLEDKPRGFWIEAPSSPTDLLWKDFAWENGIRSVDCAHRVQLATDSNLIIISYREEMADFSGIYGVRTEKRYGNLVVRRTEIDWAAVAQRYQGIIISPYLRGAGEIFDWYRYWDVASGCVWDLNVIKSIEALI